MFGKLPSYSIPDGQEGLRGSNLEKAGCCFFQVGLFDFLPARAIISRVCAIRRSAGNGRSVERGRSSVLHRRKGDDERGHTLSSEDLRPAAVDLTSFVGRCPAACRGVILLSSPKEESRKQRKKCHRLGWTFSGIPPRSLTSFITERSKQERCHRFDAVDADQGAKPPGPRTAENYQMPLPPASTRPTLRAGGSGLSAAEKMKSIGPAACKEKASVYRSCCRTFHPACKVRPGAAGGEMAELLSWAGVQGLAGPSDHIASLRRMAQCRQRPER